MNYKSIRVEVDMQVYKCLLDEQQIAEQSGIKKSLAAIFLGFACDGMGIELPEHIDRPDVQDNKQNVQFKSVQLEQGEDVQPEQREDVHAEQNKTIQDEQHEQEEDDPYGLPNFDLQKERILYIMDCEHLDADDMAEQLGVDVEDLSFVLSNDMEDDMEFSLLSKVCKVFGSKYNPWWIRDGN